jgi:hypothetical protein
MVSVAAMIIIAATIERPDLLPAVTSSRVLGFGIPLPHHCRGHGVGTVPCQKGCYTRGKCGQVVNPLIAWVPP